LYKNLKEIYSENVIVFNQIFINEYKFNQIRELPADTHNINKIDNRDVTFIDKINDFTTKINPLFSLIDFAFNW